MKRIMVTGGSGLLGGNCLVMLREAYHVVGIFHATAVSLPGVEMCRVDLRNHSAVADFVRQFKPDAIIHCAALTDVDYCEANPDEAMRVNRDLVANLARLSCELGGQFVHISTDAVYGDLKGPSREDDLLAAPVNVYAHSKLLGEQAALAQNPSSLVLRTCIYGWNVSNKLSFSESILKSLLLESPITLFRDVFFSPILVNDLVDVIVYLLEAKSSGIYNVGAPQGISKLAFGLLLAKLIGLADEQIKAISVAEKQLVAARPLNPVMDVEKVMGELPKPLPSVEEGLDRFLGLLKDGYVNKIKPGIKTLAELREVWRV